MSPINCQLNKLRFPRIESKLIVIAEYFRKRAWTYILLSLIGVGCTGGSLCLEIIVPGVPIEKGDKTTQQNIKNCKNYKLHSLSG